MRLESKSKTNRFYGIGINVLFSALLFVAFFLFGCGGEKKQGQPQAQGGANESTAPAEKAKGGIIEISVNNAAHEGDDVRIAEQNFQNELWMKRHNDSKLKFDDWQYSNDSFLVKMKGGTATDIIGLFATEGTMVIEKGYALDLTEYLKKWDKFPLINPEIFAPFSRDGKIYGLPASTFGGGGYVMTLFYNIQMFKDKGIVDENGNPKPPQTWEEFVDVAKKLTDKSKGIAGFGILADSHGSGWHFLNWVWQAGGDFEKNVDGKWKAVFDSPEAIKALQFVKDLRWKHDVLQSDMLSTNDDLFKLFVSERIGMALFTPEYLQYLVEKLEFPLEKIGIALLPAGPGGRANQMGGGYSIINPNIDPRKIQYAIDLLLYSYEPEYIETTTKYKYEKGKELLGKPPMIGWGMLPLFKPEYQKEIDKIIDKYRTVPSQAELMAEAVKYVHAEPPFYCQQLYGEALGPAVQNVLTNKDADPEKILKEKCKMFQERFLDKIQE